MKINNNLLKTLKEVTPLDLDLLHHLYLYRCLTIQQAKHFIYHTIDESLEHFEKRKIRNLVRLGVVDRVEYLPNQFVVFLTTLGVDIVRYSKDIPLEIFNSNTKIVKRGYYRAGELRMNPRLVNHQVFLNQFVLEFAELANQKQLKWKYYDEKYVSQYFTIRPDGLIQLLDTDFFLEMDMGTESKKQLMDKWNHYRDFIRSSEFANNERKITVLFITENVKNVDKRKELIRYTASTQISDLFQESFDMVIGSKDELLDLLLNTLIPNIHQENKEKTTILNSFKDNHGFQVDFAAPLKKYLNESDYEFYIRKVNPDTKRIVVEDGKLQEYVLDDYTYQPLSVIHRIQYHNRNANVFYLNFKRKIPYIVVAKDETSLYNDLQIAECLDAEQVYYTTPKRLKELPFHQALFQFDVNGDVCHFKDYSLKERVRETHSKIEI